MISNPILTLGGLYKVRHVGGDLTRDGQPATRLQCPGCALWRDLSAQQWHGREAVQCDCGGFAAYVNFAALPGAEPPPAPEAPEEFSESAAQAEEEETSGQPGSG